eukprot:1885657-Heterocapsa_arctica.AAC.1
MSSVIGNSNMSVTALTAPSIDLTDGRPQRAGQSLSMTCVVKLPSISSPSTVLTVMGMTTWCSTVLLCAELERVRVPYDLARVVGDAKDLLHRFIPRPADE